MKNAQGYTVIDQDETKADATTHEKNPLHAGDAKNPLALQEYVGPASTPNAPTLNAIYSAKFFLTVALIQEAVFLFYQEENTHEGILDLGLAKTKADAEATAWPLAIGDFGANITATNPDDADAIALNKRPNLDNIKYLMKAVDYLSHVSYLIGASASGIPVLTALNKADQLTQQILTPLVVSAFAVPGDQYYSIFNAGNLDKTYVAAGELLKNPLKPFERIASNPVHALRYFEALLRYISVVGFRTTSFVFIAEALTPLILKPYNLPPQLVNDITSVMMAVMGLTTFVNVSMTRFIRSFTKLINPKFDTVTLDEYNAARSNAYGSVNAKLEAFISHVASTITAAGYALYASSLASNHEWEMNLNTLSAAIVVGSLALGKSAYVEHTATIFNQALKDKEGDVSIDFSAVRIDHTTSEENRIEFATKAFAELTKTYESTPVELLIAIVDFVARAARMLSFYAFLVTVSAALKPLGFSFTQQEIFALCLILAPENFKNDFLVFQCNMRETITGYLAKNTIETHKKGEVLTKREALKVYFKGPLDFDVQNEMIPALLARQEAIETAKSDMQRRLISSDSQLSDTPPSKGTNNFTGALSQPLSPFNTPHGTSFRRTDTGTGYHNHFDNDLVYEISSRQPRARNIDPVSNV